MIPEHMNSSVLQISFTAPAFYIVPAVSDPILSNAETFTITVLQSGTGSLIFEYKQNWSGGESDGKYALNVTATEENGKPVITDAEFTRLKDDSDDDAPAAQSTEYSPSVQIDGVVYQDTGYISSASDCGNMDGEITSTVGSSEMPSEDDQSNFGTGYGYQLGGGDGLVFVNINDHMEIFRDINSGDESIPDQVASFIAQVEKIDSNTVLLKYAGMPADTMCAAPDAGEYTASASSVAKNVKAGDYVMVWYTGDVAETYPGRIEAYSIQKTEFTPAEGNVSE